MARLVMALISAALILPFTYHISFFRTNIIDATFFLIIYLLGFLTTLFTYFIDWAMYKRFGPDTTIFFRCFDE